MKKLDLIIILILGLSLNLFLSGCSDKDDWQDFLTDPALNKERGPHVGTWLFIGWSETDASGNIIDSDEWTAGDEGSFTLYVDNTYSFDAFRVTAEGSYTFVDNVLTFVSNMPKKWWRQPWNISFEDDKMLMGMGDWPTGEGEGYILQKE